jgi:hypothetical protein
MKPMYSIWYEINITLYCYFVGVYTQGKRSLLESGMAVSVK